MRNSNTGVPAVTEGVDDEFKRPYTFTDLARLSIEDRLELMIVAEELSLGWAYITVTVLGTAGPRLIEQPWFPKSHHRSLPTLKELTPQEIISMSHTIDFAIDIFIRPRYIDLSSVNNDPDSPNFSFAKFLPHRRSKMVLANGRNRIKRAISLIHSSNAVFGTLPAGIPWLVRFYDLDQLKNHPLSMELKYVIIDH